MICRLSLFQQWMPFPICCSSVPEAFLAEHEYRVTHPDDFEHLTKALRTDPELRQEVLVELRRALAEDPNSRRAIDLAVFLDLVPRN